MTIPLNSHLHASWNFFKQLSSVSKLGHHAGQYGLSYAFETEVAPMSSHNHTNQNSKGNTKKRSNHDEDMNNPFNNNQNSLINQIGIMVSHNITKDEQLACIYLQVKSSFQWPQIHPRYKWSSTTPFVCLFLPVVCSQLISRRHNHQLHPINCTCIT